MGSRADLRASLPKDLELPERYELLRRIAIGGMASVWCAEDRVLGRRVAIKLLSEAFAHEELGVRRFKREARVAARLSGHQNIVTIFDVGEAAVTDEPDAPGRAFIVMEYLAGGTVADALRVGAVERDQAINWLRETAAALDYAHGHGVIHRRLRPRRACG
jgi:serine/threonine protein kinase